MGGPGRVDMTGKGKVGLVLAGGGAKGAYQIGALKAFEERGIVFGAMSGTSIGAFNAALGLSGDLDHAGRVWNDITTTKLMRVRLLLPLNLLVMLLGAVVGEKRPYATRVPRVIVAIVSSLVVLFMFLVIRGDWATTLFLLVIIALNTVPEYLVNWLNVGSLRLQPLKKLIESAVDLQKVSLSETPTFVTICRKTTDFGHIVGELVAYLRAKGDSPWREEQLLEAYHAVVGTVTLPLIVDMRRVLFSMSWEKFNSPPWSTEDLVDAYRVVHGTGTVDVPEYVMLNGKSPEEVTLFLLASMALPFGLFGKVQVRKKKYSDGGLADNTPIYPLLVEGFDTIYVVHLKRGAREKGRNLTDNSGLFAKLWSIDDRRRRAGFSYKFKEASDERVYGDLKTKLAKAAHEKMSRDSFVQWMLETKQNLEAQIIHVVPSESLGMPFLSTVFFGRKKTESLMRLGYRDTIEVLDRIQN
jgi:predicted acylesterase/phospholipase RssA